jgi:hypothetical protein
MIAIHFGKQLAGSMYDEVQSWALEYDLSIEDATNRCYKYMTWSLSEVNNNCQSHFDIMFSNIYKCLVNAPDVIFDVTDLNGFKTPTLLLKSNYVAERYTERQHHIGIEVINTFGQAFQEDFGLEYLGFELNFNKENVSANPVLNDYRSRPRNSVIYLISNKPHYYDGKRFLPIISMPYIDKVQ